MLIISKFKDYYDKSSAYGVDKTVVYKREEEELGKSFFNKKFKSKGYSDPTYFYPKGTMNHFEKEDLNIQTFVVGFCGKLYPGYQITDEKGNETNLYTKKDVIEYMNSHNIKIKKREGGFLKLSRVISEDYINHFFESQTFEYLSPLFQELNAPIFVLKNKEIHKNTNINQYQFGKVKNSVDAFQEIYMYIGGVLGTPEKEMIKLSDTDLRDKKGFDSWSFKKLPSKK